MVLLAFSLALACPEPPAGAEPAEAVRAWRAAAEVPDCFGPATLGLASLYHDLGDVERALEGAHAVARAEDPTDRARALDLLVQFYAMGEVHAGRAFFTEAGLPQHLEALDARVAALEVGRCSSDAPPVASTVATRAPPASTTPPVVLATDPIPRVSLSDPLLARCVHIAYRAAPLPGKITLGFTVTDGAVTRLEVPEPLDASCIQQALEAGYDWPSGTAVVSLPTHIHPG